MYHQLHYYKRQLVDYQSQLDTYPALVIEWADNFKDMDRQLNIYLGLKRIAFFLFQGILQIE